MVCSLVRSPGGCAGGSRSAGRALQCPRGLAGQRLTRTTELPSRPVPGSGTAAWVLVLLGVVRTSVGLGPQRLDFYSEMERSHLVVDETLGTWEQSFVCCQ